MTSDNCNTRAIETEVIFLAGKSEGGGYIARAIGESIFTQAETLAELQNNIREAVHCHYAEGDRPRLIRLHIGREEVFDSH